METGNPPEGWESEGQFRISKLIIRNPQFAIRNHLSAVGCPLIPVSPALNAALTSFPRSATVVCSFKKRYQTRSSQLWFLYLDESGDLGFDFDNKNPSRYFTVAILALRTSTNNRGIINAVKKTLRRTVNPKRKRKRLGIELKGSRTSLDVKKYFFRQVSGIRFGIYSVTLNKRRLYP